MNEYRIKWCACPHVRHTPQLLFVEADNESDAIAIARNHVERKYGYEWFSIQDVSKVDTKMPAGRVTNDSGDVQCQNKP